VKKKYNFWYKFDGISEMGSTTQAATNGQWQNWVLRTQLLSQQIMKKDNNGNEEKPRLVQH
jgi:hypothetical protein